MRRKIQPNEPRLKYLAERHRRVTLETLNWKATRAGRWIDPITNKSYTAQEAWSVIESRGY